MKNNHMRIIYILILGLITISIIFLNRNLILIDFFNIFKIIFAIYVITLLVFFKLPNSIKDVLCRFIVYVFSFIIFFLNTLGATKTSYVESYTFTNSIIFITLSGFIFSIFLVEVLDYVIYLIIKKYKQKISKRVK